MYLFPDPLEESDVWMDEAYNPLAPGLSTIVESPVYMHKIDDPLGISSNETQEALNRKSSVQTLEELFPKCKTYIHGSSL